MAMMKLIESCVGAPKILESGQYPTKSGQPVSEAVSALLKEKYGIPSVDETAGAIRCRLLYPIANFGKLNRNNRLYTRECFTNTLNHPQVTLGLVERNMFMQEEHPDADKDATETARIAGVVRDVIVPGENIEEAYKKLGLDENQAYAVVDAVNTPYGQVVETLVRAGCGYGVSTRANGELEECIDESISKEKFMKVKESTYLLETIDFTANPSTYGALPSVVESQLKTIVQDGLKNKTISESYAKQVLGRLSETKEPVKTESVAVNLKESVAPFAVLKTESIKEQISEVRGILRARTEETAKMKAYAEEMRGICEAQNDSLSRVTESRSAAMKMLVNAKKTITALKEQVKKIAVLESKIDAFEKAPKITESTVNEAKKEIAGKVQAEAKKIYGDKINFLLKEHKEEIARVIAENEKKLDMARNIERRIIESGLNVDKATLALLRESKTLEDLETMIVSVRHNIRESGWHSHKEDVTLIETAKGDGIDWARHL